MKMIPLYRGFDGLDVSFRAQISQQLRARLEDAKLHAQSKNSDTCLPIAGMMLMVASSGARGGYAYRVSSGRTGATWFFKKPNPSDPWGVRVSCSSFMLALNGLGKARIELYEFMERLCIQVEENAETIGRVDFAVDVLAPDFVLDPQNFVMHSNANRADHVDDNEKSANGKSGRTTSVTVGKMPGRQVIVYDKRAEVIARHKWGWFEIWNAALERLGLSQLEFSDPLRSRVWRVEVRAGKKHLKEHWGIKSWADLDNKFGDLALQTVEAIRLTQPISDSNRSRWPNCPLWNIVCQELREDLFEMRNFAAPDRIKQVHRDRHLSLLFGQSLGLLVTRAAIAGVPLEELPAFAKAEGLRHAQEIIANSDAMARKLSKSAARYDAKS